MMNGVLEFLADVPPMLTAGWAVWFGTGALLLVWYRKAKASQHELQHAAASRTVARTKSGPRTSAGVRPLSAAAPVVAPPPAPEPVDTPVLETPKPVVAKPRPAPIVVGDPFGDLATLLDQAAERSESTGFRKPGDSPILNSAGEPVRNNE